MRAADWASVDAFEQAVAAVPHVRQAQRLFGEPDYLLRVIAADLPAFQQLYDRPPGHPSLRAAPQLHPGHEEASSKTEPSHSEAERAVQTPLDRRPASEPKPRESANSTCRMETDHRKRVYAGTSPQAERSNLQFCCVTSA
jgi:hypothetical protein